MPLELTERFIKQYKSMPRVIQKKIEKTLLLMDKNFRHPGLKSRPIEGAPGIYEARVDDKYRVTYQRNGDKLILRNVDNHDECLKNP